MDILQQGAAPPQQGMPPTPEQTQGVSPEQMQEGQEQPGLSFTTEQLIDSFKEKMKPESTKNMMMVIDAGKQLLFGEESHYQLMGMLDGSKNIGKDLGNGAFDAMTLVLKSMGDRAATADGEAILPAGVALIAMTLEYLGETGTPVSEDDFEEATHIFGTRMMDAHDPEFKQRREQYAPAQEGPQDPNAVPVDPNAPQPPPAAPMPSQGSPLLTGGM